MKFSDIGTEIVKEYLRVYDTDEDNTINAIIPAAKHFILSYTGLCADDADKHEDLSLACLILCSDMFDSRSFTVQSDRLNPAADTILHMYAENYL